MSGDQTESPTEVGNETVLETPSATEEVPTLEQLQAQIDALTAERDELKQVVDGMPEPVKPILFEDFADFVAEQEAAGTSKIDLQAEIFTHFVIPLKRRGFKVELNTATAEGGMGRESSNGTSHKSQYLLSDPDALNHIDPEVLEWYHKQNASRLVFGETSYISADDAAATTANATTGKKFKR